MPAGEPLQTSTIPPRGPSGLLLGTALRARRDPFGVLEGLARDYGDVVRIRIASRTAYLINDPSLIRAILVDRAESFPRGVVGPVTERLLGGSIVGSEGADHHAKKAAARPIVSHGRLEGTVAAAARITREHVTRWAPGATIDMAEEMAVLSMRVAAECIFSIRGEEEAVRMRRLLERAMAAYELSLHPMGRLLGAVPSPGARRKRRATEELQGWVDAMVRERLAAGTTTEDVLGLLLGARVDGTAGPTTLPLRNLRAIALDIMIASHATLAHALAWTLHDMSAHPEAQERVALEVAHVIGDKEPRLSDISGLTYTKWCFKEGLRLHPPVWAFVRRTVEHVDLNGLELPAGALVVLSPRLTHRDARFFDDPSRFDPQRWARPAPTPGGGIAYFPFGAGPYGCLGDGLAMAQGPLVLGLSLRSRTFARDGATLPTEPAAALQPEVPIRLRVGKRPSPASAGTQ